VGRIATVKLVYPRLRREGSLPLGGDGCMIFLLCGKEEMQRGQSSQ
jgi:hypothetical protein